MMSQRTGPLVAALLAGALMLSGCGGQSTSAGSSSRSPQDGSKETIKIGAVLPMTGSASLYGEQAKRGIDLALKEVNEKGILGGRKVDVIIYDDQAKPEEGVGAMKKLVERDKVSAVMGGINSSVVLAEVEALKTVKVPFIVTAASHPDITEKGLPYLFRLNTTNAMDGAFFHEFMAKKLGLKRVAVLVENTDYGQVELKLLKEHWQGANVPEIVQVQTIDPKETDFSVPLTKIKGANPDGLYVVLASPHTTAAVFLQARELAVPGVKLLAPRNLNSDLIKLAGKAAEGVISCNFYVSFLDKPSNQSFVKAFKALHSKEPDNVEMLGYESLYLVVNAMEKAGTATDPDKTAQVLRSTQWTTPRGSLTFDTKGQANGELISLVVKNQTIEAYK